MYFFSDLVTAVGKFVEQFAVDREAAWIERSNYDFPREEPLDKDWELWISCLKALTVENFELPTPLGRWENPTHRLWEWLVDDEEKFLNERRQDSWKVYTRQGSKWASEGLTRLRPDGKPASVKKDGAGRIKFRSSFVMVQEEVKEYETF